MERSPLETPAVAPLKVGDVVRMKGIEGPRMVVSVVRSFGPAHEVLCLCMWFDAAMHERAADFPARFLEVARD